MNYRDELNKRIRVFQELDEEAFSQLDAITALMFEAIKNGNKVMTCGNGGSAANAQHITGDIVGRYKIEREAFAGLSLTVDPSVMTATGNDYGYDEVFARQVEGLGREGDVLVVLSSSAQSPNLIKAVLAAGEKGIKTVGILGNHGGGIIEHLDEGLTFAFKGSDLVEETAMTLFHIMLMDLEQKLTGNKNN